MKKVVIDSCVFFHMLKANEVYMSNGRNAFDEYSKSVNDEMQTLKNELCSIMDEDFLRDNAGKTTKFTTLLDMYNVHIKNLLGNIKNEIKSVQNSLKGEFKNKDGSVYKVEISEVQKLIWENQLQILNQKVEQFKENIKKFDILTQQYKDKYQPYICTKLYNKMLNGEVEFLLVQDSYKEIINHIGNQAENKETFKYFKESDVNSMLNNCEILGFNPELSEDDIESLSQQYRTRDDDKGSCMDGDKNSLKVYGDSRIMAEASMAGYTFITLNEKDFITDKSKKLGNDFIRRHIQEVNRRNPKIAHDIMICSPQDYLAYLNFQKSKSVEC